MFNVSSIEKTAPTNIKDLFTNPGAKGNHDTTFPTAGNF